MKRGQCQLTLAVSHAVEEQPLVDARSVAGKGYVMAGFDAEDGKELHGLARDNVRQRAQAGELLGQMQLAGLMAAPGTVLVNLQSQPWKEQNKNG